MLQTIKYAKELSLAIAVIFLTFLTVIYFAVTKYLTRSGRRNEVLLWLTVRGGYSPSWQGKQVPGNQAAGRVAFAVANTEQEVERGYCTPSPALTFPSARVHLLQVPQPSQKVPKATCQVSLWGTFHIQTLAGPSLHRAGYVGHRYT